MRGKKRLGVWIRPPQEFEFMNQSDLLFDGERADTKAQMRRLARVFHYRAGNSLRFLFVRTRTAAVEHSLRHKVKTQTERRVALHGAGHDEQPLLIERLVGDRNQRMVPAPVMPLQHGLRQAARTAEPQHAFHVCSLHYARLLRVVPVVRLC